MRARKTKLSAVISAVAIIAMLAVVGTVHMQRSARADNQKNKMQHGIIACAPTMSFDCEKILAR